MPFQCEPHQDGGRQNHEIETTPRAAPSVKGPPGLAPSAAPQKRANPDGAIEMTAKPGDAVFLGRPLAEYRDSDVAGEEIARLVGHASSKLTETVYRHQLRPVLTTGAEKMDARLTGT